MNRILSIGVLCAASGAFAYSPPPASTFTRALGNGDLIFVMFSPHPQMDRQAAGLASLDPKWRLRRKSGLYRINSASDPIWTFDEYATSFEICSDGVHLVIRHPAFEPKSKAISFFKNGKLLRTYTVGELADTSDLKPDLGPLSWSPQMHLDDERKQYFVKTSNGESYTFDIATGRIISHRVPRLIAIASSILVVGLCAIIFFMLKRRGMSA